MAAGGKIVAVPEALLNQVVGYLVERPYKEVAPLLNGLSRCKVGEFAPSPDPEDKPEE